MRSQMLQDIRSGGGSAHFRRDASVASVTSVAAEATARGGHAGTPRSESRERAAAAAAAALSPTSRSKRPDGDEVEDSPLERLSVSGDDVPFRRISGAL